MTGYKVPGLIVLINAPLNTMHSRLTVTFVLCVIQAPWLHKLWWLITVIHLNLAWPDLCYSGFKKIVPVWPPRHRSFRHTHSGLQVCLQETDATSSLSGYSRIYLLESAFDVCCRVFTTTDSVYKFQQSSVISEWAGSVSSDWLLGFLQAGAFETITLSVWLRYY